MTKVNPVTKVSLVGGIRPLTTFRVLKSGEGYHAMQLRGKPPTATNLFVPPTSSEAFWCWVKILIKANIGWIMQLGTDNSAFMAFTGASANFKQISDIFHSLTKGKKCAIMIVEDIKKVRKSDENSNIGLKNYNFYKD